MAPRTTKKTATAVQPIRKSSRLQQKAEAIVAVATEQNTARNAIVNPEEVEHFNLEGLPNEIVYKIIKETSIFGLFNLSITSHLLRNAVVFAGSAKISIDIYNEEARLRSESSSKSAIVFESDRDVEHEDYEKSTRIGNTRILVEEEQYYDHAITRVKSYIYFEALADFLAYLKARVKTMSVSVVLHNLKCESFKVFFGLRMFDLFDKIEATHADGVHQERNYERLKERAGAKFEEPN